MFTFYFSAECTYACARPTARFSQHSGVKILLLFSWFCDDECNYGSSFFFIPVLLPVSGSDKQRKILGSLCPLSSSMQHICTRRKSKTGMFESFRSMYRKAYIPSVVCRCVIGQKNKRVVTKSTLSTWFVVVARRPIGIGGGTCTHIHR